MVEGGTWFPWLVQLLDDFAPNTAGIVHGIYPNCQLFATLRFSSSSFQVAWQPDALWFEFRGYWSFTVESQCCHVFHKVESKCNSRRDDQTLTCFLKSYAHGSIGCWFCVITLNNPNTACKKFFQQTSIYWYYENGTNFIYVGPMPYMPSKIVNRLSLCRLMTALRVIDVGVNLRQQWISAEQQEQKGYEVFWLFQVLLSIK